MISSRTWPSKRRPCSLLQPFKDGFKNSELHRTAPVPALPHFETKGPWYTESATAQAHDPPIAHSEAYYIVKCKTA